MRDEGEKLGAKGGGRSLSLLSRTGRTEDPTNTPSLVYYPPSSGGSFGPYLPRRTRVNPPPRRTRVNPLWSQEDSHCVRHLCPDPAPRHPPTGETEGLGSRCTDGEGREGGRNRGVGHFPTGRPIQGSFRGRGRKPYPLSSHTHICPPKIQSCHSNRRGGLTLWRGAGSLSFVPRTLHRRSSYLLVTPLQVVLSSGHRLGQVGTGYLRFPVPEFFCRRNVDEETRGL